MNPKFYGVSFFEARTITLMTKYTDQIQHFSQINKE